MNSRNPRIEEAVAYWEQLKADQGKSGQALRSAGTTHAKIAKQFRVPVKSFKNFIANHLSR